MELEGMERVELILGTLSVLLLSVWCTGKMLEEFNFLST